MSTYIDDYLQLKRNQKTRQNNEIGLKRFLNWKYQAESAPENLEHLAERYLNEYQFQDLIEYVVWLRDEAQYQPLTISVYVGHISMFLKYYERPLTEAQRIKLLNAMPRALVMTQDKPLTKEIISQLCLYSDPLLRVVILLATSSGMRINEILRLERSEIEFGHPNKIHLPKAKMKQGRPHTYRFSTEAAEALREWFAYRERHERRRRMKMSKVKRREIAGKEDPRVFPISTCSVYSRWRKMLELIGLDSHDKETGRLQYSTHGCRRWFSSTASRHIPHEIAEALIGHDTGLSVAYRRYPEDELDKEYVKLEPHLSIFAEDELETPEIPGDAADILYSLLTATTQLTEAVSSLQKKIEMITVLPEHGKN